MAMNYERELRARNCNTILRRARDALLRRLPQDQLALRRWQREGKLPDLVFHPDAENEILLTLPRADPLVAGREEDPAVGFGIARVQRYGVGLETLRAQKLDELGSFLLILSQPRRFFFGDLGILLDLALGFEDQCIHVVLQFSGQFRGIREALKNVAMTNEVDPHVRRKLKFVLTGVRHTHVHTEEVIEATSALSKFLRVHEERDGEVTSDHRPAVASVLAAFECATGRTSRPAHGGQLLFFLGVAKRRRQNRTNSERKFCPEEPGTRHKCRVYRFCTGNVTVDEVHDGDRIEDAIHPQRDGPRETPARPNARRKY